MRSMISGSIAALRSVVRPLRAHRGEQHLLGRADAGEGQVDVGRVQAAGGGEPQAVLALLDLGAELAQHVEVVVDRALADAAARRGRG